MAQIYLQSATGELFLLDELLGCGKSLMTLLVIDKQGAEESSLLARMILDAKIHSSILSKEAIYLINSKKTDAQAPGIFVPIPMKQLNDEPIRPGYDEKAYISRLGKGARYVIARPDFYIFAIAADLEELGECLLALRRMVEEERVIVGKA